MIELPPRPAWMRRAACLGLDPEIFFPGRGVSEANAKAICAGCPVRKECLEHALETRERFGIRGGLSERQRRRIRSQRYRPGRPAA